MKLPEFKDLILFEDEDYVVINKPPFLATLDERFGGAPNILRLAREQYDDIQACHRLDKETSGSLALAKNPAAYRHLAMQFEDRQVKKVYHAVSWGVHEYEGLEVDRSIETTTKGKARLAYKGKPAVTLVRTLETYARHTLLECQPITGRMHQIRLHLAYLQAPIVGDTMYGGDNFYLSSLKKKFNMKQGEEEQPFIKRFALHARQLTFSLLNGEPITVEAPYPKDFRVLVENMQQYR
ncbi:RluA family pseudouridine synthase [Hymenobacter taeanensis]|uniref:RluA family pseudouridine synthase n=1 Tax=Hymenobacter taeanensis TaxID=2735321 RepID=A0A6M6BDJ1_9BACT|nr:MULTISPECIES: RluA family pseudouridine synthase [Hymenobacter]QJX46059.1 RluA family pseudouridine synthase [Hymenobacter taeanensis]UOQ79912.1 RluA family pseudouridine synthase [Hymenobacter sp. 5414T-23]